MIYFRKAKSNEAQIISELAIKSKAHWCYSSEFMEACKAELTHIPEQLVNEEYLYTVVVKDESIVGFYQLENTHQETIILAALFVEPLLIGCGLGRNLYEHAKQACLEKDAKYMEVQSDPNSEGFYKAVGMNVTGETQSVSIVGRYLPTLSALIGNDTS